MNKNLTEQLTFHPDSIIALTKSIYVTVDIYCAESFATNRNHSFCKRGCNLCCNDLFYVSRAEYYTIKNHLLSSHTNELEMYVSKAKVLYKQFKNDLPEEYEHLMQTTTIENIEDLLNPKESNLRFKMCLFNDPQTGSCNIYDVRPFVCRIYGIAWDSDLFCENIQKEVSSWRFFRKSRVKKRMIQISPIRHLHQKLISFESRSQQIKDKPMPLIYWFANDDLGLQFGYKYGVEHNLSDFADWLISRSHIK